MKFSYKYSNGDIYKGEWQESSSSSSSPVQVHRFGQGTITYQPHGQGTITYNHGGTYEGGWSYGKPHGQGTITNVSGHSETFVWENGIQTSQPVIQPVIQTEGQTGFEECCVCYEPTTNQTPCGHPVCSKCIGKLTEPKCCPMCRVNLKKKNLEKKKKNLLLYGKTVKEQIKILQEEIAKAIGELGLPVESTNVKVNGKALKSGLFSFAPSRDKKVHIVHWSSPYETKEQLQQAERQVREAIWNVAEKLLGALPYPREGQQELDIFFDGSSEDAYSVNSLPRSKEEENQNTERKRARDEEAGQYVGIGVKHRRLGDPYYVTDVEGLGFYPNARSAAEARYRERYI